MFKKILVLLTLCVCNFCIIWLAGFSIALIGKSTNGNIDSVFMELIPGLVYFIYGIGLFSLNVFIFHLKFGNFLLIQVLSFAILVLTTLIAFGTIKIKVSWLNSFIEALIVSIYHAEKDPMGVLVLSIFNIPLLFVVITMTLMLSNLIYKLGKSVSL